MGNLLLEVGPWAAHEGMGWWMLFGGTLWLIFWATVIYLAVSAFSRPRHAPGEASDALEVAKWRYARGEISREEFERIRSDLGETHSVIRYGGIADDSHLV